MAELVNKSTDITSQELKEFKLEDVKALLEKIK